MKENHDLIAASKGLLDNYDKSDLTAINVDELVEWIKSASGLLQEQADQYAELAVLRDDFTSRVSGMAKAIAVTQKHPAALHEAAQFIETLNGMTSEQLVTAYRRLSAKFRGTFPTSLTLGMPQNTKLEQPRYADYK